MYKAVIRQKKINNSYKNFLYKFEKQNFCKLILRLKKKTLYKINAEIDRKYKSSKAYKKSVAYSI